MIAGEKILSLFWMQLNTISIEGVSLLKKVLSITTAIEVVDVVAVYSRTTQITGVAILSLANI